MPSEKRCSLPLVAVGFMGKSYRDFKAIFILRDSNRCFIN